MAACANNNETPSSDTQPNKRRRKKSMVWEYFTIETINADCTRALCKQCKKSFAYISGSKLAGTSHLKRHIALGICPMSRLRSQVNNPLSPSTPASRTDGAANVADRARKRYGATPGYANISFDQDHCNHEIAKMIIQHEYPLDMVEHPGFINFARTLQPQFNFVNSNSVQEHIFNIYLREKQNLLRFLDEIPGRISLTVDLWASDQSLGYVFLTGHFIDSDWKLHRRLLNIIMSPYPDSEVAFNHAVAVCLSEWNFENKLFALTLDDSSNESVKGNLRGLLSINNPPILNGQLIISSCYARVLSHLAQDAIILFSETVEKVRQSVKYIKSLEAREEKFLELKPQLQVPSAKSLIVDDLTKWDTTFHMLMAASELKEVFSCLDTSDPDYRITPSMEEWRQVETLCTYLRLFFEAADILTAPVYPTANMFFHQVWKIQLELINGTLGEDPSVSNLTKPLLEKFDRYWRDCNLVLATAVVMDPRFKMKLVEFSFNRIYGADAETWIKSVDEAVHELFLEYLVQSLPPPTFLEEDNDGVVRTDISQDESFLSTADGLSDFDIYISGIMSNQQMRTELDQYLGEPLLPRVQDFDVLSWWRTNRSNYPTLSKMASDILSIPFSTVAPDSVFDNVNRKMDSYRSSLRPITLEALVCTKDWLRYESLQPPSEIPTAIVKMEY